MDEVAAQAAYGLMAVHGRAADRTRFGVDYVSTVVGVVAARGALAAALSTSGGHTVEQARVPAAALLTVSQYLAACSAHDPDHVEAPEALGAPPPFTRADGVRAEPETLDPEPRRRAVDRPGHPAARGRAVALRYATAGAPLPDELRAMAASLPYARLCHAATEAGVAVQPLRGHAERAADPDTPPWTLTSTGSASSRWGAAPPTDRPLAGTVVVEADRRIQGPLAGHVLRMLGAEVVRGGTGRRRSTARHVADGR
ncbi:hypothetical protein RB614_35365 [Phytohabitans sp. ZYX-F-186]|uniref:CoA transferase n=1 Tax=Phytohabitans maris TaxID=3071409 RepID=A0ABU0ZRY9_9ACTN|nr:CoA transferase [Phytohabitans sp. ZYX-F-186]MDQ7909791.1 hypothetical protein [Phytohabitans sp. ZYX-F-186]